jgi:hypothetical protein
MAAMDDSELSRMPDQSPPLRHRRVVGQIRHVRLRPVEQDVDGPEVESGREPRRPDSAGVVPLAGDFQVELAVAEALDGLDFVTVEPLGGGQQSEEPNLAGREFHGIQPFFWKRATIWRT